MLDFSIPQAGLDHATTDLNRTASRVANVNAPNDSVDLSSKTVSLMRVRNEVAADTRVLRTEEQMMRNLLDEVG